MDVLTTHQDKVDPPSKRSWIGIAALYLVFVAVVIRTLAVPENRLQLTWYLILETLYILVFTFLIWKPAVRVGWMHASLIFACTLVLFLLSLRPEFDFVILLFFMLVYHVTCRFTGRVRWIWIGLLIFLTSGPLIFYVSLLRGLGLSLTTIAAEVVLPALMLVNLDIQAAQNSSQLLLNELEEMNHSLQSKANEIEELTKIEERNHLARELHDSVSQLLFSISLTTSSTRLLLEKDRAQVQHQLNCLEVLTSDALRQLRSLITQLRPPQPS